MTIIYASEAEKAAYALGAKFTESQNNLMAAYALPEGSTQQDINDFASRMKLTPAKDKYNNDIPFTIRSIQLVAEQRFQHSSQLMSLFSNVIDKIDQMKQRLIQKFGQG